MSKSKKKTENIVEAGDLVTRIIRSHYTNHNYSDAIGVVLKANFPVARVYFYDTSREEVWNQKVLTKISKT